MTFFGALYQIFIGPLEIFFEILYFMANKILGNYGLSIIVLSLVMNILLLPLYRRADAIQDEQRDTEKKLKKGVTHIKKTFTGDERFMMLQTYYRQNHYNPASILKGSISLLLEIPFFIAAYNFLSNAGVFEGYSFGPFADFGQPDGLIKIADFSINLLPILMTAINIVSSIIYTKGLPASSKVQLYGMAGLFLILLYNSPACLVFYWTLNNLFSLIKNIFCKLKRPKLILGIISGVIGLLILIYFIFINPFMSPRKQFFVVLIGILMELPVLYLILRKYIHFTKKEEKIYKSNKPLFFVSVVLLAVLTGWLIPSSVISSSPEEFINTVTLISPLRYVFNDFLVCFGTFVVWFSIVYMFADNKNKHRLELLVCIIAAISVVNYMCFGKDLGTLSSLLKFDSAGWATKESMINILVSVVIALVVSFIWVKKQDIIKVIYFAAIIGIVSMSSYNCVKANKVIKTAQTNIAANNDTEEASIPLSKNGKNVMVFMMDRAIGTYVPYIFNEKPELKEKFEGFTYYPNTISFGGHTNFGLPAVLGGYEYTPEELNKRDTESLADKQNEAWHVMPVIFDEAGYEVTLCDPTYAGYKEIPDLSIFDDYPDIHKYITMGKVGMGQGNELMESEMKKGHALEYNLVVYSFMKILPFIVQGYIYDYGGYCSLKPTGNQNCSNVCQSTGLVDSFVESYNVLCNLDEITNITENGNTFMFMCNNTTHEPSLLKTPDYVPADVINNQSYFNEHKDKYTIDNRTMKMEQTEQARHYHANMAAAIQMGNYFDYLRENNVYDNTRIIIVADHGFPTNQFDDLKLGSGVTEDVMGFNPILMVKDFNSSEFTVDNEFMTNGDVPTLATEDIIENPVNPFTNKVINSNEKTSHEQHIIHSEDHNIGNNGETQFHKAPWYSVHDNIFDTNNWAEIKN